MPRRARILAAAAVAAMAALWAPSSAVQASPLPCNGFGGQGAGGYISSMVTNCLSSLGH